MLIKDNRCPCQAVDSNVEETSGTERGVSCSSRCWERGEWHVQAEINEDAADFSDGLVLVEKFLECGCNGEETRPDG